jgi:phosphoribosylformimino-5-aminoimidazole carboxamide ribotide isomerase
MLIIPAVDLMGGKVVRLIRGDFKASKIYSDSPIEVAKTWQEKGVQRIHIVDLDGANTGQCQNLDIVKDITKELEIPIELGGGIRTLDMVKKVLDCGVEWAILSTKALEDEAFLEEVISSFPNRIIVSADVKDGKIFIKGWKDNVSGDISMFFEKLKNMKLPSIIVTDIQKDGTLEGANIELFTEICKKSPFPIIVAGGVSSLDDIKKLSSVNGVKGAIIGKALYEGRIDLEEAVKL